MHIYCCSQFKHGLRVKARMYIKNKNCVYIGAVFIYEYLLADYGYFTEKVLFQHHIQDLNN